MKALHHSAKKSWRDPGFFVLVGAVRLYRISTQSAEIRTKLTEIYSQSVEHIYFFQCFN
jgi:hypothetical protein